MNNLAAIVAGRVDREANEPMSARRSIGSRNNTRGAKRP